MKKFLMTAFAIFSLTVCYAQPYLPLAAGPGYPLTGLLLQGVTGANQIALNASGSNYGFLLNNGTNTWSLGYGPNVNALGASVLTWNGNGNVGIGTTNPTLKLDVAGPANFGSATGDYALSVGGSRGEYGSIGYNVSYGNTAGVYSYKVTDYTSILKFFLGGFDFFTAPVGTTGSTINYTNAMHISQNGNIGIGTTNPTTKLEVAGPTNFGSTSGDYALSVGGNRGEYGSIGYNVLYGNAAGVYSYKVNDYTSILKFFLGGFDFLTAPVGTSGSTINYTNAMHISQNGNTGIGILTKS